MLTLTSTAKLANGVEIPYLGLGVYASAPGHETLNAVLSALETGYRHIDTARIYNNEADVGQAIRESGLPREQVFVTTKLWNSDHGFDNALKACSESLNRLGLDYVDLYLIHWPVEGHRAETWKALEKLMDDGYCRAIGVSNFTIRHLNELTAGARVAPLVNQVEFSPFLYQRELLEYCRSHNIQLEAYSPLTRGQRLNHPAVVQIAQRHGKSPAQILIRWALEHRIVVIPKSVNPERIQENAEVFDFVLSQEDLKLLDSLNEDFRTCWDPTAIA